jgi:hypothetical protein
VVKALTTSRSAASWITVDQIFELRKKLLKGRGRRGGDVQRGYNHGMKLKILLFL